MSSQTFGSALAPRALTVNALFAALLGVSVVLTIPVGTVPFTLQLVIVLLIALIVPPSWAAVSVGVYLLAGAIGLPVFSGVRGGIHVLLGPTGGYLIGFLLGAIAGSWVRSKLQPRLPRVAPDAIGAAVVVAVIHLVGWLQLMLVSGMSPLAAALSGFVPFIVFDALKAAGAVAIAPLMRRAASLR